MGGFNYVTRGCYHPYMAGLDDVTPCYSQSDFCNDVDIMLLGTGNVTNSTWSLVAALAALVVLAWRV